MKTGKDMICFRTRTCSLLNYTVTTEFKVKGDEFVCLIWTKKF